MVQRCVVPGNGGALPVTCGDPPFSSGGQLLVAGGEDFRFAAEELVPRGDVTDRAVQADELLEVPGDELGSVVADDPRPALVVGRDGITVGNQPHGFFEIATCATVSVPDRRGKRRGTVSLGFAPELGQQAMTDELLARMHEIPGQGTGVLPQRAYVSDAGGQEETFYTQRLSRMRRPLTKTRLRWQRVVDYCHAAQRLTTLAEALRLDEDVARAWARRMRRVLKEPHGVSRVLHSAGLPIGSGVTEAACKTLFTTVKPHESTPHADRTRSTGGLLAAGRLGTLWNRGE